jgi:hypothetical protein
MSAQEIVQTYIENVLRLTREKFNDGDYELERLPPWIRAADVRMADLNGTVLYVVRQSDDGDTFEFVNGIDGDLELLLDVDNVSPAHSVFELSDDEFDDELDGRGDAPLWLRSDPD